MCHVSPDFRSGDLHPRTVLMGACPGQVEQNNNRPFAGAAGRNLTSMLSRLTILYPQVFPSRRLDDYTLANAHDRPLWQNAHRKTEPSIRDVGVQANIDRLLNQIDQENATTLIGFGRRSRGNSPATKAITLLKANRPNLVFYICGHPSPRAVNRYARGDLDGWIARTFARA